MTLWIQLPIYSAGLLHWLWGNRKGSRKIAPVLVKQPWNICVKSIGTKQHQTQQAGIKGRDK